MCRLYLGIGLVIPSWDLIVIVLVWVAIGSISSVAGSIICDKDRSSWIIDSVMGDGGRSVMYVGVRGWLIFVDIGLIGDVNVVEVEFVEDVEEAYDIPKKDSITRTASLKGKIPATLELSIV